MADQVTTEESEDWTLILVPQGIRLSEYSGYNMIHS